MSVMTVNDGNFDKEVLESALPVLVQFCKDGNNARGEPNSSSKMSAVTSELAKEYGGKVKVLRKELDKEGKTERKYKVESAPITLLIKDGEVEREVVGYYALDWMKERVNELLKLPA